MTDGRRSFVDTNVFLASTDTDRVLHQAAVTLLETGLSGQRRLFTSGQVFREYLVVATRPVEVNGLELTIDRALENIRQFQQFVQVLDETSKVAEALLVLVRRHDLKGKRIHDANIVATMRVNGLSCLYTNNPRDFAAFEDIEVGSLV